MVQTGSPPTVAGPDWTLSGRDLSVDGEEEPSAMRGDVPSGEWPQPAAAVGDPTQLWSGLSGGRREAFSGVVWVEVEDSSLRVVDFLSLLLEEMWRKR